MIAPAGERPDLTIVRLGDRADVERFVEALLAALARTIYRPLVHVAR